MEAALKALEEKRQKGAAASAKNRGTAGNKPGPKPGSKTGARQSKGPKPEIINGKSTMAQRIAAMQSVFNSLDNKSKAEFVEWAISQDVS